MTKGGACLGPAKAAATLLPSPWEREAAEWAGAWGRGHRPAREIAGARTRPESGKKHCGKCRNTFGQSPNRLCALQESAARGRRPASIMIEASIDPDEVDREPRSGSDPIASLPVESPAADRRLGGRADELDSGFLIRTLRSARAPSPRGPQGSLRRKASVQRGSVLPPLQAPRRRAEDVWREAWQQVPRHPQPRRA